MKFSRLGLRMIVGFSHLICITFNGKSQRAENSVSCAMNIEFLFAWGATTPHSYKHSLLKHHKSGLYITLKGIFKCIRVGVEFSLHLLYAHCFASSLYSLQESGNTIYDESNATKLVLHLSIAIRKEYQSKGEELNNKRLP